MYNKNIRTLIIGFSICGKNYLMSHILLQKQGTIFLVTKSPNQHAIIKAQTLDETEPLENYENSSVLFDDMLLSKPESNIDLFFTRGRHQNIDIYYISQSCFLLPKNTIRKNSNVIILIEQTLRDIILLFPDIAGLDMILEEWNQLCHKVCNKINLFKKTLRDIILLFVDLVGLYKILEEQKELCRKAWENE